MFSGGTMVTLRYLAIFTIIGSSILPSSLVHAAPDGGSCKSDSDCDGNLDCIHTGFRRKSCAPVTCAKGAAFALLEEGFDAEEYIATIRGKTGLRTNREFVVSLEEDKAPGIGQILANNPPPMMAAFQSNYSACLHPERQLSPYDDGRRLQTPGIESTLLGLMWSAAAGFSYFGKSTWGTNEAMQAQLLSNCLGAFLGVDAGIDFLIQIFNGDASSILSLPEEDDISGKPGTANPGDFQFVPAVTVGPIGIQIGWGVARGPQGGTITEVSIGPSFGFGAGGFTQCFNTLTLFTPPRGTPEPTTPPPTRTPSACPSEVPSIRPTRGFVPARD